MDILLSITAFLLSIAGIAGCILPLLPGPALCFAGLLCAFACSYSSVSPAQLLWWLAAVAAVTIADYFLPAYTTKLLGGSRAGQIGATLGLVAGIFFFPTIVGFIIAPFFGAVLGELTHNKKDTAHAFRVGLGSFISFAVGTGIKLIVCIGILVHVATDTYPVIKEWIVLQFA